MVDSLQVDLEDVEGETSPSVGGRTPERPLGCHRGGWRPRGRPGCTWSPCRCHVLVCRPPSPQQDLSGPTGHLPRMRGGSNAKRFFVQEHYIADPGFPDYAKASLLKSYPSLHSEKSKRIF